MTALVDLYRTSHSGLVAWIAKEYAIGGSGLATYGNVHRLRRESIARRLRLYRDQSAPDIEGVIAAVYETAEYIATLKRYVVVAREQNVTRRIVDEIASLYDRPALRVLKDAGADKRFQLEEKRLRVDEIAQEGLRMLTLCNEVLEWQFNGVDGKTKLRLVTPDCFDAIPDPRDTLVEAGILLDMRPATVLEGDARSRLPHYELWDDTFRYLISGTGMLVDEAGSPAPAPAPHGLGRIPGVLQHRREPTTCLLDADTGSDIESAHLGIALLNVQIARLSKSQGENQPVLSGNLSSMASGQVMNGEKPLLLPPEVVASMLSMKTDPDHYLSVKRDKLESLEQAYGINYSNKTDAASGFALMARREKLTEIRLGTRKRSVMHEGQRAELMGFDQVGMRVDYQEQATPLDPSEEVALLKENMRLGLDSPIAFMMRKDPDLTREAALVLFHDNIRDWAALIEWVRALNAPADGDGFNAGKSPQQNGANNSPGGPDGQPGTNPPSGAMTGDPATGMATAA